MRKQLITFALILVIVSPWIPAALATEHVQEQISQSNRFLSAEVQRQIQTMKDEVVDDLRQYQDENFGILDQRLMQATNDMRWQITIGAMGAVMVANAIVALVLIRTMKTYSYEQYQAKVIESQRDDSPAARQQDGQSFEQMQQNDWNVQNPARTMGAVYGQGEAANMSQMNQWQAQPAYDGAWAAPVETHKEFNQWQGDQQWSNSQQQWDNSWQQDPQYDNQYGDGWQQDGQYNNQQWDGEYYEQ